MQAASGTGMTAAWCMLPADTQPCCCVQPSCSSSMSRSCRAHAVCRHTAMLLGAAKLLKQHEQELQGSVKLLFQPAEEGGAGGKRLVKEGERALTPLSASSASARAGYREMNDSPQPSSLDGAAQLCMFADLPHYATWVLNQERLRHIPLASMQAISRASRASLAFTCGQRFPLAPSTQRRGPSWHLLASLT